VSDEHGQLLMRIALAEEIGLDLFPPEVREHVALLDPAAHDELRAAQVRRGVRGARGRASAPGEALLVLVLF
jgi:hypothetical protein